MDLFSLIDIYGDYTYCDDVIKGETVMTVDKWTGNYFDMKTAKREVQFIHAAFHMGKLREGEGDGDCPSIAMRFLSMWHKRFSSQSGK